MTGRLMPVLGALISMAAPLQPASAQRVEDTVIVPAFAEICVEPPGEAEVRAAIAANAEWQKIEPPARLKIAGKEPRIQEAWSRRLNDGEVLLVLSKFPKRNDFMCTMLIPDVQNMLPYFDGFREVIRAKGLKGRETDIPHYYRATGKMASGIHAVADLNSRSPFLPGEKAMHMWIVY